MLSKFAFAHKMFARTSHQPLLNLTGKAQIPIFTASRRPLSTDAAPQSLEDIKHVGWAPTVLRLQEDMEMEQYRDKGREILKALNQFGVSQLW